MLLGRRAIGTLSILGLILAGCETTNPQEGLHTVIPIAPLKANKNINPNISHAFLLLKEEKYSEASSYINQSLQTQPKSLILHLLNAFTYEKLAEDGDSTNAELATVGYQNALSIDPFNSFAITQLAKLKYRDQQYDKAQEHFAQALLIKPNDPDLIHEFAAASYYAYDLKTAFASIKKALKMKPNDPLIHRSAVMIYAAMGDFKTAEKHLKIFQDKIGPDPEVNYVANRFNDWQSLYKSGRIRLAAAQSSVPSNSTSASDSSSSGGSATPGPSGASTSQTSSSTGPAAPTTGASTATTSSVSTEGGGEADADADADVNLTVDIPPPSPGEEPTQEEFKAGEISATVVESPVTPGIAPAGAGQGAGAPPTPPSAPPLPAQEKEEEREQIVLDCYILQITEDADTIKGNNVLNTLAITLNPGSYSVFNGNLWGSAVSPLPSDGSGGDTVGVSPDSAYATSLDGTGRIINTFNASTTTAALNNQGSFSGKVFAAGISWAGLTYSLNIANSADVRTEIMSRPTLMTYLRKESRFFSGTELVNVSQGNYGSNLSRYQVGTTISVIPESLEGEMITLNIGVEASVLQNTNPNLLQTVDVGKTRVETTARVRLGDTIMLGGIYERDDVDITSGFPGLKDLPLIQYFFSRSTTVSSRRSIVVLVTPRSPDAVKSAVNRAMARESVRPHYTELVSRNPDWFRTDANAVNIFRYINLDPVLYYEFRSGDILPPSWKDEPVLKDKLAELASFLYY